MTKEIGVRFFCLLAVLFWATTSCRAQSEIGSINGVALNAKFASVAGAKVVAIPIWKNARSKIETPTDGNGHFKFTKIHIGVYDLAISCPGYQSEVEWEVEVRPAETTIVTFLLKPIQPGDVVSIVAPLTDSDKAEMVGVVMEDSLVKKTLADWELLIEGSEHLVLSIKNIKPAWVPSLPQFKMVPLSPRQIQKKADQEGDFLYLCFSEFKVIGPSITVSIANSWAVGKHSGMGYLSGGGSRYEFHKVSGKWVGKIISAWIS